ncbi:uncharacterized protein BP01DRAFT_160225 [Aspergillus saccharolyticus JOP 1030-1]|uniref:Uncharacterized protein n=1 Tax=Aspergillus saccharolyticus JOP 1030-1 TaxID=1450539 RepID=A0A318Z3G2_9EURO|nr:hypothetical protein BP01DRAFT_160225 [Aspergillus saccharolyticus JOP 1030-1]PYH41851.1 hypothetical protein BP01DRAFT_160225 [Aspergillus saccharolyticus JOP 1030-1]
MFVLANLAFLSLIPQRQCRLITKCSYSVYMFGTYKTTLFILSQLFISNDTSRSGRSDHSLNRVFSFIFRHVRLIEMASRSTCPWLERSITVLPTRGVSHLALFHLLLPFILCYHCYGLVNHLVAVALHWNCTDLVIFGLEYWNWDSHQDHGFWEDRNISGLDWHGTWER